MEELGSERGCGISGHAVSSHKSVGRLCPCQWDRDCASLPPPRLGRMYIDGGVGVSACSSSVSPQLPGGEQSRSRVAQIINLLPRVLPVPGMLMLPLPLLYCHSHGADVLERSDDDNGWGRGVLSVSSTKAGAANPASLQRTAGFLTTLECCCGGWGWV